MLRERMGRWLRLGLILIAIGSVAVAAARVTWHVRGHDRVIPPMAVLDVPDTVASQTDLGPSLALAPFGNPETPDSEPDVAVAAQELVLLGVIVRDDPKRSLALIRVAGTEDSFRLGDEIASGTTILEIAQDRVVLDAQGGRQTLYFTGSEAVAEAEPVPTGAQRLLALATSGQGTSISAQVDAAQRAEPETTQDYIDMWRDRIIANPAQVLDEIGLVPSENGYIISDKHDVGVNRAGLRAGDIVTSVNGLSVGDVDKDRELYDVIAESGLARIEIERDGRTIVMSFPLQ